MGAVATNNKCFVVDGPYLPERFGRFDVKRRYYLWWAGVLEDVFKALRTHADQEWLMMDATIVRAHAQAAGARHKKGGLMPMHWGVPRAA